MVEDKENYNQWHQKYAAEDDTGSEWHLFVKKHISINRDVKGAKVLEIGCGRGGFSNYLAGLSPALNKMYACDYSETAIDIGKSKFGTHNGKIIWAKEDIQNLSFEDDFFDTIISCETIEHVPIPSKAVQELYRVLKPGGRLFLTCPNYFNFFGLWCMYRYIIGKPYTEGQPYVNYLVYPSLINWIKKSGFIKEENFTSRLIFPLRAHYHFFQNKMPIMLKWFGFRCFFILNK